MCYKNMLLKIFVEIVLKQLKKMLLIFIALTSSVSLLVYLDFPSWILSKVGIAEALELLETVEQNKKTLENLQKQQEDIVKQISILEVENNRLFGEREELLKIKKELGGYSTGAIIFTLGIVVVIGVIIGCYIADVGGSQKLINSLIFKSSINIINAIDLTLTDLTKNINKIETEIHHLRLFVQFLTEKIDDLKRREE